VLVDQLPELMHHHTIGNGVRCLDDVPVEEHLTLLAAGSPGCAEVADADL
jgi:hypothetical protein